MFKESWEKTKVPLTIDDHTVREMVALSLPNEILESWKMISGGCANLNLRLILKGSKPFIVP